MRPQRRRRRLRAWMSRGHVFPDRPRCDPAVAVLHGFCPHRAHGLRVVDERCQFACLGLVGWNRHLPNWGQYLDDLGGLDLSVGVGAGEIPASRYVVDESTISGSAIEAPFLDFDE